MPVLSARVPAVCAPEAYVRVVFAPTECAPEAYVRVVFAPTECTPEAYVRVVFAPTECVRVVFAPMECVPAVSAPEACFRVVSAPTACVRVACAGKQAMNEWHRLPQVRCRRRRGEKRVVDWARCRAREVALLHLDQSSRRRLRVRPLLTVTETASRSRCSGCRPLSTCGDCRYSRPTRGGLESAWPAGRTPQRCLDCSALRA